MKDICKVDSCRARAWQRGLCNLHALERHRSANQAPAKDRLAQGKQLLRDRAKQLGIELSDAQHDAATRRADLKNATVTRRRRVRSPVG